MSFTPAGRAAPTAVLVAILAGAGFGYYLLGSGLFDCGRQAGAELAFWLALAAIQGVLYMLGSVAPGARTAYRWTQIAALPVLGVALFQLAWSYPRLAVCIAGFAALHWALAALPGLLLRRGPPSPPQGPCAAIAETAVFLLATLVVHSGLAFAYLHSPGVVLDDRTFWCIALVSAALCSWLIRAEGRFASISIAQMPPLALLILVLLRAKFPDNAYDTLFYKATLPITIADWRTALTGAFDHSLLGSDLAEIAASQLRILDPSYPIAMGSSLGFLALWMIAPIAARGAFGPRLGSARDLACNAGALVMVSVTEPLIAAGTAYHEPLMSALMAAFFLPLSLGWVFLAAAIASKATVVMIAPVLVVMRLLAWPQRETPPLARQSAGAARRAISDWGVAAVERIRARPLVLAVSLVLALLVVGEQVHRNVAMTGRVLGISEMFVGMTDPDSAVMAAAPPAARARPLPEQLGRTFVHILTLDRWIKPGELDFHIIPSSRFAAIAAFVSLLVFGFPALRRDRALLALCVVWLACAVATLTQILQGRHLSALSFASALVVAYAAAVCVRDGRDSRIATWALCVALAIAAASDQAVGTMINNGWDCRRGLAASVSGANFDRPETALEKRLAEVVAQYKAKAPPNGPPPTVVCENTTERKRYLGTHHIYAYMSAELTPRFVKAQAARADLLPTSILALCFNSMQFVEQMLPPAQRGQFVEVPGVDKVRILVSRPLMAGAKATSMPGSRLGAPWGSPWRGQRELLGVWEQARLHDHTPMDTPSGKGTYVTGSPTAPIGVLISHNSLTFEEVDFRKGDRVLIELAMPYSNSDGMRVEVVLEGAGGARYAEAIDLLPKPKEPAEPAWQTRQVNVPAGLVGRGRLTLAASSPSGNGIADWVFVKRLSLQ